MSCSAAALVCAMKEISPSYPDNYISPDLRSPDGRKEHNLYAEAIGHAKHNAYVFPHGLSKAAKLAEMKCYLIKNGHGTLATAVSILASLKVKRLNYVKFCQENGVDVVRKETELKGNERKLIVTLQCDGIKPIGLHYLMERPDGSVMDPATGKNYKSLKDTEYRYLKTNISIVVAPNKI